MTLNSKPKSATKLQINVLHVNVWSLTIKPNETLWPFQNIFKLFRKFTKIFANRTAKITGTASKNIEKWSLGSESINFHLNLYKPASTEFT